ncbi:hypothetical protein ACFL1X_08140, partial [Candidatus Hydrogenedentota bacterium]
FPTAIAEAMEFEKGEVVDDFRQTESYVVKLDIDCERVCENLVVADLLPAGFEIANPRLNADSVPGEGFKNGVHPTHLEIRDDRLIVVFRKLGVGKHSFYYVAQAVTPGKYQYPAVAVECMYDGSIHGSSKPSMIEVTK